MWVYGCIGEGIDVWVHGRVQFDVRTRICEHEQESMFATMDLRTNKYLGVSILTLAFLISGTHLCWCRSLRLRPGLHHFSSPSGV